VSNFALIDYDGINLFHKGEWTGLEVPGIPEGRELIGFLDTLSEEQVAHYIRVEKHKKGGNKTFSVLKNNTRYSGETTAYEHKDSHGKDAWKTAETNGAECIEAHNIFEVQWSNCPVEVEDEVRKLWSDMGFGNDHYYYTWIDHEEHKEQYPVIAEFLESRGITKCLIHWWW